MNLDIDIEANKDSDLSVCVVCLSQGDYHDGCLPISAQSSYIKGAACVCKSLLCYTSPATSKTTACLLMTSSIIQGGNLSSYRN